MGKPTTKAEPKKVRFSDIIQEIPPLKDVDPNVTSVPRKPIPASLRPGTPRKPATFESARRESINRKPVSKPSDNRRVPDTATRTQHRTPGILNVRPPVPSRESSNSQPARAPPSVPRKPVPAQTKKEPVHVLRRTSQRIPPRPHLAPPKPQQNNRQQTHPLPPRPQIAPSKPQQHNPQQTHPLPPRPHLGTPKPHQAPLQKPQTTRQRQRSLGMIPDEQYKLTPKPAQAQPAATPKLSGQDLELLVRPEDSASVCEWYQTMSVEKRSAITHALCDDDRDKDHPDVLNYNLEGGLQSLWLIDTRYGQQQHSDKNDRIQKWLDGVEEVGGRM